MNPGSDKKSLYLHVANSYTYIYLKTQTRKWLMTFTLLLSFFAISGYVNTTTPNINRIVNTEVLTARLNTLNYSISYKRASTLLFKNKSSGFILREHFDQDVLLHNKLAAGRYKYLKQLFSFTKSTINYPILHQYYTADQHKAVSSFQIG
jgi:hypothetical protein